MSAGIIGLAAVWAAIALTAIALFTGRRWALVSGAVMAGSATVILAVALLTTDFSLVYVAETTSLATPWPYRLAAVWGGMDGSMLFYSAITLVVAAAALGGSTAVRVAGGVGLLLLAITIFFANPFVVADLPSVDGEGLLAILQHPAMVYHPPLLYLGLTVLIVPFASTVEMVLGREGRARWMTGARRWLYLSWTLLTVGMVAGASWAYVELGWGGYWAWDPVENTALMPWLAVTVFLHSSRLEGRRATMRRWSVLFAMLPFALTLAGVYLTRSGATGSIHSFAEDPVVGRILLVSALAAVVGVSVLALRSEPGQPWGPPRMGRDWWLGLNAILLTAILVFVTAGSIYPAFSTVFLGREVAVDARYFVVTVLPLAVVVAASLGLSLGPKPSSYALLTVMAVVFVLAWAGWGPGLLVLAPAAVSLVWLGANLARGRSGGRRLTLRLAHLGMAVFLVGVAGSSFGEDFSGTMVPGDMVEVGRHEVTLRAIETGEEERIVFVRASFEVDGATVSPEIRAYEDQAVPVAEPALRSTPLGDVTVAISLLFPDGNTVAVSVFARPLVWWVWAGAALMALAGLSALFSRSGAAAAPRPPARAGQRPAETTTDSAPR